jgi:hypothetical protein
MPVHETKVCVGGEVQLHSFLTSAVNGTSRQPKVSVTLLREWTVPPVTVEREVGYHPPPPPKGFASFGED